MTALVAATCSAREKRAFTQHLALGRRHWAATLADRCRLCSSESGAWSQYGFTRSVRRRAQARRRFSRLLARRTAASGAARLRPPSAARFDQLTKREIRRPRRAREPTAVIPGYCDHAPDSRRTQPTLIRTRDCPMADQCDAEPMRASRARSRSLRPEQQSTRPVHRPVRTKATGEASKPGSCFSNVAAGTPACRPRAAQGELQRAAAVRLLRSSYFEVAISK